MLENIRSDTHEIKKPFNIYCDIFSEKTHSAEKGASSSPNAFFQAENFYESERDTL